jgi:tRNA pseudouridine55 synthase
MSRRRRPLPGAPEGGLVIDKPAGMTSHDVVAGVRRALGQPRVGHAGTLDPMATGVLPLLLGRATRLAQFVSSADKTYLATVRFGQATSTYDAEGDPVGPASRVTLERQTLERLLEGFRGRQVQSPPAVSAKRVGGTRAYVLARSTPDLQLPPVPVEVHALTLVGLGGADAQLRLDVSAGYYVRSLAHDLGVALGTGAHLVALTRERSGQFTLGQAVPLREVLEAPAAAVPRVMAPVELLPGFPRVVVDATAAAQIAHGRPVEGPVAAAGRACLVGPDGRLLALAECRGRLLHPFLVLV